MYFAAFHQRMNEIYNEQCNDCGGYITLTAGEKSLFQKVQDAAKAAYDKLTKKGSYSAEDITEYSDLINATADVFNDAIAKGIKDNDIPPSMLQALESDAFLFGGLKAHAQLLEGSTLMKNGRIKSQNELQQELNKLNLKYNEHYLGAEYEFAVQSSQMAAQWADVEANKGRYNLQYRTAQDEHVRASHQALDGITLPAEEAFWNSYYPPNGWRCRCHAVEVSKEKYPESNSKVAVEKGEKATTQLGKGGKNKLAMFRFNPGKSKVVFPPDNTYGKVKGSDVVKKVLKELGTSKKNLIPKEISDYEDKLNLKINKDIFSYLKENTPLLLNRPTNIRGNGAFYHPENNYVHIPIDDRRKNSTWYAKAVVYHEFGHAADFQFDLKNKKEVIDLMNKYRGVLDFKKIDATLEKLYFRADKYHNYDLKEQVGAAADVLKSLNVNYGAGHTASYFREKGKSEAEFIAHAFENTFSGNKVFKKYMPELYKESIELVKEFKPKQ